MDELVSKVGLYGSKSEGNKSSYFYFKKEKPIVKKAPQMLFNFAGSSAQTDSFENVFYPHYKKQFHM